MKTFMIVMLIGAVWVTMQSKNYMGKLSDAFPKLPNQNNVSAGLPKLPDQNSTAADLPAQDETINQLPAQEINRMPEASASDLAELGMEKNAISYDIVSPMIAMQDKMKKTEESAKALPSKWNNFKKNLKIQFNNFNRNSFSIFAVLCALVIMLRLLKIWNLLKFVSDSLFGLSRLLLFLISISSFFVAYYYHANIWDQPVFFLFPTGVLCLSAFGLWTLDNNFPIWKRLYGSFILPIISGIGVNILLSVL
ncbi:MAG: hypothetical protein LHV68_13435 [Elusimicrobia bacterium]|nr:hypothetical protein [Candidatus Liberimonas magnetica]